MSGFFAFLVHASHRSANGQRSRKVRLMQDALVGESRMKGKRTWTKWAAPRRGVTETDWAQEWLAELNKCNLPGPDYVVRAPTSTLHGWLNRPAGYNDFRRSLHLLLMLYAGETPATVVEYTPHSCRHVQVTAGTQLAAQGFLTEQSMATLGHWEQGSKMPKRYDSAACVSELHTRSKITEAIRTGWRPATDGQLPTPPTPVGATVAAPMTPRPSETRSSTTGPQATTNEDRSRSAQAVVNKRRNMAHMTSATTRATRCGWFTCGTPENPAPGAIFGSIGKARRCKTCFGGL